MIISTPNVEHIIKSVVKTKIHGGGKLMMFTFKFGHNNIVVGNGGHLWNHKKPHQYLKVVCTIELDDFI
jgi:hypothetical protein